ncbi:MAG: hypothetical protein GX175_06915 [Halanaerobiaceae bacterium]|nr:hypothetical protein [Halanaerobiaceae bacterium]
MSSNGKYFLMLLFIIFLSSAVFSEITQDETRRYLDNQPVDFLVTGEDVIYADWLDEFVSKNQVILNKINRKYTELEKQLMKVSIGEKRESYFAENSDSIFRSRMIVGDIEGDQIVYSISNVKSSSFSLVNIKRIIEQGTVEGAFVDNNRLFIITQKANTKIHNSDNILPIDIPFLLKGFYESTDYYVWQSIDVPDNPLDQHKYGMVRYGGAIEDTHVAAVFYEADRLMKCLSIGYDNRMGKEMLSQKWQKSEWDFMPEISIDSNNSQNNEDEWQRYWFTLDESNISIDPEEKVVRISGNVLTVKTEKMKMIKGHLESINENSNKTPGQKWVEHFNKNFNLYQREYPFLYKLEQLARWSALFLALRECGVVFEDIEISEIKKLATPVKTPVITIVTERTVKEETDNYIKTNIGQRYLSGGVAFDFIKTELTDLSSYKKSWLSQYEKGNPAVERVF